MRWWCGKAAAPWCSPRPECVAPPPYLERYEYFYTLLTGAGVDDGSAKEEADAIAAALSTRSF